MKKITLLTVLMMSMLFVSCKKQSGNSNFQYPYNSAYCNNGQMAALPYNQYYNGQPVQNVNCLNPYAVQGMNPLVLTYSMGNGMVHFMGTCDLNLMGQHCPNGYTCQPMGMGSYGICARMGY